jgi:endonuclease/exonuclease/phosphatase family metal-dependent hydrolase
MDGKVDVGRIAAVIAAQTPDIVALQEVDVGRARTGGLDQAHEIAWRLGMSSRFHAALRVEEEQYGDALLTRLPERLIRAGPLPGCPPLRRLEPRGALWVAFDVGHGREVQVLNTHLGLVPREQWNQAGALAGPDWLSGPLRRDPVILVGDFNMAAGSRAFQRLAAGLRDAQATQSAARGRLATFPSRLPLLRIDHVLTSPGVRVSRLFAPITPLARVASDHLPLVADFDLADDSRPPG